MIGAGADDKLDLVGRFGKHHRIGRLTGDIGGGVGMLGAQRLTGLQPVPETLTQYADDGFDPRLVAKAGLEGRSDP
jgi:hypothetical protein